MNTLSQPSLRRLVFGLFCWPGLFLPSTSAAALALVSSSSACLLMFWHQLGCHLFVKALPHSSAQKHPDVPYPIMSAKRWMASESTTPFVLAESTCHAFWDCHSSSVLLFYYHHVFMNNNIYDIWYSVFFSFLVLFLPTFPSTPLYFFPRVFSCIYCWFPLSLLMHS